MSKGQSIEEKDLESFLIKVIDLPSNEGTLSELYTLYRLILFSQKIAHSEYQKELNKIKNMEELLKAKSNTISLNYHLNNPERKNINKEETKIIMTKNIKKAPDISEFAGKFVAYEFKDEDNYYKGTPSFILNNSRCGYIENKKIIVSDKQHAYPIRSFIPFNGKPSIYIITSRHLGEEGNIKMRLASESELHFLKIKLSYWEISLDGYTRDYTLSIIDNALQEEYKVESLGEVSENTFNL